MNDFEGKTGKIRREYQAGQLDRAQLSSDPHVLFQQWLQEVVDADVLDATAMTLATVDQNGRPAARIVLLKGLNNQGLQFFTDYSSRKGQEIASNPQVAVLFYWKEVNRQVRITGTLEKLSDLVNESYFDSRPEMSRWAAIASDQSQPVQDRQTLEAAMRNAQNVGDLMKPARWGGYHLYPDSFEFWQGRPNRLHDRFLYILEDDTWRIARLQP
ncbi:MAG: pyridoxamine 5'-phosphate oxidase [Pseudomonadota bacterium]